MRKKMCHVKYANTQEISAHDVGMWACLDSQEREKERERENERDRMKEKER